MNTNKSNIVPKYSYFIFLDKTGTKPREIIQCDSKREMEAMHNLDSVFFDDDDENIEGLFIAKISAVTMGHALRKAIFLRDEAVANGSWDHAWVRHKFQLCKLDKYEIKNQT